MLSWWGGVGCGGVVRPYPAGGANGKESRQVATGCTGSCKLHQITILTLRGWIGLQEVRFVFYLLFEHVSLAFSIAISFVFSFVFSIVFSIEFSCVFSFGVALFFHVLYRKKRARLHLHSDTKSLV